MKQEKKMKNVKLYTIYTIHIPFNLHKNIQLVIIVDLVNIGICYYTF